MGLARVLAAGIAATTIVSSSAGAQFTYDSPTGAPLPASVSRVGGIVADLIGANGNRVVSQRAASGLFSGGTAGLGNPIVIGTQSGFTPAVIAALGGGIQSAAFRLSLFDGDTRSGEFDEDDITLRVNGIGVGNFSDVQTVQTDASGNLSGATGNIGFGFGNQALYTGFFFTSNAAALGNIFAQLLATGNLVYQFDDADPGDQSPLNFNQGIAPDLVDIGQPPVVTDPNTTVPEPGTYALLATGLVGLAGISRRMRRT